MRRLVVRFSMLCCSDELIMLCVICGTPHVVTRWELIHMPRNDLDQRIQCVSNPLLVINSVQFTNEQVSVQTIMLHIANLRVWPRLSQRQLFISHVLCHCILYVMYSTRCDLALHM